jgi:gluconokinase
LIADRLRSRHGHFAGESILASQLADLEEPEKSIIVDISHTPEQIVDEIKRALAME